jgi:2-(3-amino-3-carboxypropyl)histidine synthase
MKSKKLQELEENYELELERAIRQINRIKKKEKKILLQFPDGMKPIAVDIADYLEEETGAVISIWLGTCFGACDIPKSDADLIIQFGHAPWK